MAKPRHLPAEQFHEQVEKLMALRGALARASCVEAFDVDLNENGRIRGCVTLNHEERFFEFNDVLSTHPVRVSTLYSGDRVAADGDNFGHTVAVEVYIVEE